MPNAPSARSPSITASGISPSRSILSESTSSRRKRSSCSRNGCARRTSSGSCSGYGSINGMRRRPRNRSRTKLGATQCCSRAASATSRASSALTLCCGAVTVVMAASHPNLSGLTAPGLGGDSPRLHHEMPDAHAAGSGSDRRAHHAAPGASAPRRLCPGAGAHQGGATHRRALRRRTKQRRHRRLGRSDQSRGTAGPGAGAGAHRLGDRSLAVHRAPGLHRYPHPSAAPGRSHGGAVRPAAPVPVDRLPRHPRRAQRAARARARLHGVARPGDRRRDVRRRGHQAGHYQRGDSGPAHLRVHPRDGPDRDLSHRVDELGARAAPRRRARGRGGRRPPRGARAGGPRRRLDQILLRPPLLLHARQRAAQLGELHRRRSEGDRKRGAPPRSQGRGARDRLGRHRRRAARRRQHDRARRRYDGLTRRPAGGARRILGADRHGVALRRGAAGRAVGPDGRAPAPSDGPGPEEGRQDRPGHRRRRVSLDRGQSGEGVRILRAVRHDAARRHQIGYLLGRRAAGPAGAGRGRPRDVRRSRRRLRRPAQGHHRARARALRDEGRRRLCFALVRRTLAASLALVIGVAGSAAGQFSPPGTGGVAALVGALKQLGANKRVLMIGAHPDDEYSDLVALFARGLGAQVAYLSLTRGEGGQNLIGPELGPELGVIRSEELLAARRIDGARQFFARAYDFGYSKTIDETLRFWPRDSLLRDVLEVVRRFRPQIIVSVFSGTPSDGHGHHQVAGVLARQAFEMLRDSSWGPAKLYRSLYVDTAAATLRLGAGALDPVEGRSYHQIAMAGRSQHRSQDQGSLERAGPSLARLTFVEWRDRGRAAEGGGGGVFAGVDTLFPGVAHYAVLIDSARALLNPSHPGAIVPLLARALRELGDADGEQQDLLRSALAAAAGVAVDGTADDGIVTPGERLQVETSVWNGGDAAVTLDGVELSAPAGWTIERLEPATST